MAISGVRNALLRIVAAALLAVSLLPLSGNVAWACLCDQFSPTAAARNATTVFTGVVRGRVAPPEVVRSGVRIFTLSEDRVDFNVETVYKGEAPSRWSVSVNATDCGYVFSDGERYTVFATAEATTNLCMGNVRGAIDPAAYGVEAITRYGVQPLDAANTGLVVLAAIVVVVLGAVAAIRMRRARSA
jgi:hypothetical protein